MAAVRQALLDAHRQATAVLREGEFRDQIASVGSTHINPYDVAAFADVPVMRQKLGRLLGAYLSEPRPGILVNSDRPKGLVAWTVAHELGHHFLGHGAMNDGLKTVEFDSRNSLHEREANQFAFGLMAPKWLVNLNIQRLGITTKEQLACPLWVYQLSLRLGLSYAATRYALVELKILTQRDLDRSPSKTPAQIKRNILGEEVAAEFDAHNDVWLLVDGDIAYVINGSPYDRYVWHRPSNGSTGYSWTLTEATAAGFNIQFAQPEFLRDESESLVGANDHVLASVALNEPESIGSDPSRCVVTLEERQPWRPASLPEQSATFELWLQKTNEGLASPSRRILLEAAGGGQ